MSNVRARLTVTPVPNVRFEKTVRGSTVGGVAVCRLGARPLQRRAAITTHVTLSAASRASGVLRDPDLEAFFMMIAEAA